MFRGCECERVGRRPRPDDGFDVGDANLKDRAFGHLEASDVQEGCSGHSVGLLDWTSNPRHGKYYKSNASFLVLKATTSIVDEAGRSMLPKIALPSL